MKKILFTFYACILIFVAAFNGYAQSEGDSIKTASEPIVVLPDSIIEKLKTYENKIQSLESANVVLEDLLSKTQKESYAKDRGIISLQEKIDTLQNITIKRLEASNDTLQRRLVSMASNFLYIPYEKYSIYEIAIPSYNYVKGTPAYDRYYNRLPLLENYKEDIKALIDYLKGTERNLRMSLGDNRLEKATDAYTVLTNLPLYGRYIAYSDWSETYLGKQIYRIEKELKSPSQDTPANLKSIRAALEQLIQ